MIRFKEGLYVRNMTLPLPTAVLCEERSYISAAKIKQKNVGTKIIPRNFTLFGCLGNCLL